MGQIPAVAIANLSAIDRIIFNIITTANIFSPSLEGARYSIVVNDVAFSTLYQVLPVIFNNMSIVNSFTFEVLPSGDITVSKNLVAAVGQGFDVEAVVYLKADYL